MKNTALNGVHREYGARMVEFAGFEMPVEYSGIKDEHLTVRNEVGVFDVSHMGEFWVKGPMALELLRKVSSNDPALIDAGEAQYTCLPNGRGGIVDDLLIYCFGPEEYLLVVNASNIEKDWAWINSQNSFGALLENGSDEISQLAVQGPEAISTLQRLTEVDLRSIRNYSFVVGKLAGINDVIISATGYTGAGGFELYCSNADVVTLWRSVFEAGAPLGIKPAGLGARDTLRLEMGYSLYGNDIDDTTSPIEAGLGWITKFNNGRDFVDRDFLWMQKNEGVRRRLRGFVVTGNGIPRHGYSLVDGHGNMIGQVTSGTISPLLGKGIGMGYVDREYAAIGTELFVQIRNKSLSATIVRLPFI